jgi:ATP-binding cassette subfamily B protein
MNPAAPARDQARDRRGFFGLLENATTALGTAAVLFIGAKQVESGALTLGQLLLVIAYLAELYAPLKTISGKVAVLQKSMASAE